MPCMLLVYINYTTRYNSQEEMLSIDELEFIELNKTYMVTFIYGKFIHKENNTIPGSLVAALRKH